MNLSIPKTNFVYVNGIRLHYLDWGGKARAKICLTGMGSSAQILINSPHVLTTGSGFLYSHAVGKVISITQIPVMTPTRSQKIFAS